MSQGRRVKGLVRAHKRSAELRPLDAPGRNAPDPDVMTLQRHRRGNGAALAAPIWSGTGPSPAERTRNHIAP